MRRGESGLNEFFGGHESRKLLSNHKIHSTQRVAACGDPRGNMW